MAEFITSEDSNSPEDLADRERHRKDISELFDMTVFPDITIVVNCVEFRANKCILSTRCGYFKTMFTSNWKEGEQNKITLNDIAPEVFKIVLEFIYKGQLSDWKEQLEKHGDDLIEAANMVFSKTCLETIGYFFKLNYY